MLNSYRKIFPGEIFGKTIQNGKEVCDMWYVLAFIGGIIVGLVLKIIFKPKSMGYLNIVNSNEPGEGPYLFLDLDMTVDYIRQQKYATFIVSQK